MEISPLIEFTKAFVKVQAQLQPAVKNSLNPHFKSKFADLASCYEACRQVLSDNGFAVLQVPWVSEEGATMLRTHLMHVSGQSMIGEMYVCAKESTPQSRGSALSYSRRYSLVTLVGLATEDDDGNHATQSYEKPTPKAPKKVTIPGEYVINFGKEAIKGKMIKELDKGQIETILQWCVDNNAKPEFQEAAFSYLDILTQQEVK